MTGEVVELAPFNAVMSKRAGQVEKNLTELEAAWAEAHPGQEPGPVVTSRMVAAAWARDRPQKRPTTLAHEDGWRQRAGGCRVRPRTVLVDPSSSHRRAPSRSLRTISRCSPSPPGRWTGAPHGASTWNRHTVTEHVTRIVTEHGVRATPAELRDLVDARDRPRRRGLSVGATARSSPTRARRAPDQPPGRRRRDATCATCSPTCTATTDRRDPRCDGTGRRTRAGPGDRPAPPRRSPRPTRWWSSRAPQARERRPCSPSPSTAAAVQRVEPRGS